MRTGDYVLHRPTGETWVVAFVDEEYGRVAWCGWPPGMAYVSDCELVSSASDDEHMMVVLDLWDVRNDQGELDFRARAVRRLYPELAP